MWNKTVTKRTQKISLVEEIYELKTYIKSKFLNFGITIVLLLYCRDNVKYGPVPRYFFHKTQ